MGRRGFSLEFGRGGSEGLGKETDENIIDDNNDPNKISKIMTGIDTSDLEEDDYSDCAKNDDPEKEESKEDDFSDCLKKSTKTEEEKLRDDIKDIEEAQRIVKDSQKEVDKLNDEIDKIFG